MACRNVDKNSILSRGQGIIYCLTRNDCSAVAEFLSASGVSILPYYSDMGKDDYGDSIEKKHLESFVSGETRILAATVKLGMGYDKSDIRFVIHFQLPQNLIAYYQQIGRAGRDGLPAYAFLLHGQEDEEILRYFIDTAQASPNLLCDIVDMAQNGVRKIDLMNTINVRSSKLSEALNYLLVHDFIYKDQATYRANIENPFDTCLERKKQDQLIESRINEHNAMLDYLESSDCFMKCITNELDAPDSHEPCGICANCKGNYIVPVNTQQQTLIAATTYLGSRHGVISPRKAWATGGVIKSEYRMQPGWVLCADYYSVAGQKIKEGKYALGEFSSELIRVSAKYLQDKVIDARIECIVPVPSLRHPCLVSNFAKELAAALGVSYIDAVVKTGDVVEQKTLLNSAQQERNIKASTEIVKIDSIYGKTVLLVDDMVDSRWTLTVIAAKLLEEGAGSIYPFALVRTGGGD